MSSKLCAPYEGNQPYLYISYCPEDMDTVLPILRVLQDEGYLVGYDDSSIPKSEWPGAAARCLDQSAVFLALISENWIASQRCLEEFTFAQMKRQPSLAVMLEAVQLTPAMKLQLVSVPAVDRSQCTTKELRNKLLEQLDKLDPDLRQDPGSGSPASRSKRPLIAAVAAVLILVAGIAALVLTRGGTENPPNNTQPIDESGESNNTPGNSSGGGTTSDGTELDYSTAYHILLTAPEDMPLAEFPEALSTLRDRLDIFTGGEPYEINVADDSVELYLPKGAFAGIDVEKVLKCYITRATNLYIFDRSSPDRPRESIRRDDLASVTLSQGTIPGVDAAQYGIYSPTYDYLTIELTDQCAEWFGDEIAEWGDGLAFGQDMESVLDYYYHYTFSAGDGKTFYLLNNDLGGKIMETLIYNLNHSPLPDNFSITIDLNSLIDWQTTEGGSRMGENQCDPDALTEATVTFTLKGYRSTIKTAEEQLNVEKDLKARLDMLNQPYALGWIEDEEAVIFAIRTGMEHMGVPIMSLIAGSTVYLQSNYWNISLHDYAFTWETAPDGTCTLALEMDSELKDQMEELTKDIAEQGGTVRLTAGDLPVLGASIGQEISEGRIIFDCVCFDQGPEITEEYSWFTALLERIMSRSMSGTYLYLKQIQMTLENGVISYDKSRFGISYIKDEHRFADAVHAVIPDVTVSDDQNLSGVYIYLNLEVNEKLPERAAALAQEIYEASGFEQSIFQNLIIYLIKEDDSIPERARIVFNKHYGSLLFGSSSNDGCTYVHGIFLGGRLDQYQPAFQHIVETDPFYLRLTRENWTSWKW